MCRFVCLHPKLNCWSSSGPFWEWQSQDTKRILEVWCRIGGRDNFAEETKTTGWNLQESKAIFWWMLALFWIGIHFLVKSAHTVLDRLEDPNSNPNPPKCRKGSIRENDEFSEKMKSFSTFLVGTETSIFLKKFKNLFNMDI